MFASPLSNRVEDELKKPDQSAIGNYSAYRWTLIPDSDGKMHLIDLKSYEAQPEPLFDAAHDVKFILTTQRVEAREVKMNNASLQASSFDKNHPTRFTIHGWNGDLTSDVNLKVTQEYLRHGDFNVVTVDWSKGAGKVKIFFTCFVIICVSTNK